MVIVIIINCPSRFNHCQKLISKINILSQHLAALVGFGNQMAHLVVMKDPGHSPTTFSDPLADSVIRVCRYERAVFVAFPHFGQLVRLIVTVEPAGLCSDISVFIIPVAYRSRPGNPLVQPVRPRLVRISLGEIESWPPDGFNKSTIEVMLPFASYS